VRIHARWLRAFEARTRRKGSGKRNVSDRMRRECERRQDRWEKKQSRISGHGKETLSGREIVRTKERIGTKRAKGK